MPLPWILSMVVAAPMADAWPYAVRALPEGGVEYRFDLTAIKSAGGTADAIDAYGEEGVKAFLEHLPREARVRVGWAPLEVALGPGGESRPLAVSFASVSDEPMASVDPLGRRRSAKLQPPLHPDAPKVLLSAEAVAYQVRSLEEAALAAVELDSERLRRELWSAVASEAVGRVRTTQGDAREGALLLAARVVAANACLKAKRVTETTRGAPDVAQAAKAELEAITRDATLRPTQAPWVSSAQLSCGWLRDRALARPFEASRAGTSAVLTFLSVVDGAPKLKALVATLARRRDRFLGAPPVEPLDAWRAQAKGAPAQALDALDDFIAQLPLAARQPPGLLALPSTPFTAFERALGPAERGEAWEELADAVQDGRLRPSGGMWPSAREAALVPFVAPELHESLSLDSGWREVLKASFVALLGGARVPRGGLVEAPSEVGVRRELLVRLRVPPSLEIEPMASVYGRLAESLEALRAALVAEGLAGLRAGAPATSAPVVAQAASLALVLRGLEALALGSSGNSAEARAARRYLSAWRREPGLLSDVRRASAAASPVGTERQHAVITGVARRELTVGFARAPEVELVGGADQPFEIDASARQKYLVPTLVAVPVLAPALVVPLEASAVRTLVDSVRRDGARAELAVSQALRASGAPPHPAGQAR